QVGRLRRDGVPGRLSPQASLLPGKAVPPCPAEVLAALHTGFRGRAGTEVGRDDRVVHAERVEHGGCDGAVPRRIEVDTVVRPQTWVAQHPHGPHVHQHGAVPRRDPTHVFVVDGDAAAYAPQQRRLHRVDAGEQHDRGARGGQGCDRGLVACGQLVDVGTGPHAVVTTRIERHQVR